MQYMWLLLFHYLSQLSSFWRYLTQLNRYEPKVMQVNMPYASYGRLMRHAPAVTRWTVNNKFNNG